MFSLSRKTIGPESQQKKKRVKTNRPSISNEKKAALAGAGVSLALAAALVFFLHQTFIGQEKEKQLVELTKLRAQLAADNVAAYIKKVNDGLEFYTDKPLLGAAVAGRDPSALANYQKTIQSQVENIITVRILPAGSAKLLNEFPPIRFSELEMIRRTEARENVFPELAKIDGKWLMTVTKPVPADPEQRAFGVLVATLDISGVVDNLRRSVADYGKATLIQSFDVKQSQVVAEVGSSVVPEQQAAPVPNSYWQILFEPSQRLVGQVHVDTTFTYVGMAAGSLLLLLLGVGGGRVIGRKIDAARAKTTGQEAKAGETTEAMDDSGYQTNDILDIQIAAEDEALLGLDEVDTTSVQQRTPALAEQDPEKTARQQNVPDVIFRAYDIRGIAKKEITNDLAKKIGQAIGSEALDNNEDTLIVGRDARTHSPELTEWLVRGILSTGCNVLNIGTVPTPLLYFATETLEESQSGVMVTASHNAAEYNGFKVVIKGKCRAEQDIKAIRSRILREDIYRGDGMEKKIDIVPAYIDTIFSDVALAGDISIVVDAANGVAGIVAPKLFEELGCQVTSLFCDLDGTFPNHDPDPSVASNLSALIAKVQEVEADLGVAFDGDGDRLVVVTPKGKIIWPDRLLMLFTKDIVSRNPGADVVFDVKSTRHLNQCITNYGGRPIMWKTGHSPMKEKMMETGALVGAEYSGHIFIKDRWYGFDDGLYAAARLIEIVSLQGEDLDTLFAEFPESPSSPEIRVNVREEEKFGIIEKLIASGDFGDAKITTLDGLRADYKNGWGLIRASNTSPNLTMRFEADDEATLHQLKSQFVRELRKIDMKIVVNWE